MVRFVVVGLLSTVLLAGCGDDKSSSSSTADSSSTSGALAISGSPPASVLAGQRYSYQPTVSGMNNTSLTFAIQNAPSWATFDGTTGALTGTPSESEVGTYANVVISVSDGANQAATKAFSIAVTETGSGSATLSWAAPTENTNGTALTNLAGFWINYGTSADDLSQKVQIDNPGILTYMVSNLTPGTWYFTVTAYSASNTLSTPSAVASYTVD